MFPRLMIEYVLTLSFSWDTAANEYNPTEPLEDSSKEDNASIGYLFTLCQQSGMYLALNFVFYSVV